MNAYLHWSTGSERKCGASCTHLRMTRLKEPENIFPTPSDAQVRLIIDWKPRAKCFYDRRLHLLSSFLLDTGCRISEAVGVAASYVDLDNMLVMLSGKGRKDRVVPISFAPRKAVLRFVRDFSLKPESALFLH